MSFESKNNADQNNYSERVWLSIFVIIGVIILEGILIAVAVITSTNNPAKIIEVIDGIKSQ